MGLDAFRKYCEMRIEALNHALRDLPEDRIRYHLCWGSWHGPHAYDIELEKLVDLMLKVRAQGYLIEAANARHEHEYAVWERVKLPAGKILIPGMVSHATDGIEHPELVAQRIRRFAKLVGAGERDRRHRLRLRRPHASADRLGEAAGAGAGRGAGGKSGALRPRSQGLLTLAANEILPTIDALHQLERSPSGLAADGTPPGVAPVSAVTMSIPPSTDWNRSSAGRR